MKENHADYILCRKTPYGSLDDPAASRRRLSFGDYPDARPHKTMTHIGEEVVRQGLVLEVGQSQEEKVLEQNPSIFSVLSCQSFMY